MPAETPTTRARRLVASRWVRVLAVVVVLACLGWAIAGQWRVISAAEWDLDPGRFALATVVLALSFAIVAWLWGVALAAMGGVPVRRGARIWFLSNLARYIPGSVWSILGAVELARRDGATRRQAAAVVALTQLLSVGVALLVGLPVLVAERDRLGAPAVAGLAVVAVLLGVLWLLRHRLAGLLRRRYPDLTVADLVPPPGLAARLVLGYAVYWVVAGLAFGLFAAAVYPPAAGELPLTVAAFAAAYAVGFLSLLTPSGLGVREGILVLVLTSVMPAGVAAVVAVGARAWMMAVELLGAAITVALAGRGPQGPEKESGPGP